MDYCYVEFTPKDRESLHRATKLFGMIMVAKTADETADETLFISCLTKTERDFFWNPSPDEEKEWNDEWFSTPIAIRHSPTMLTPQWYLQSMLDAFCNGDYDLIDIQEKSGSHYLMFNPHGYPYGGTACMVVFLECFGHKVIGIYDGIGYEKYTPQTKFWKPKSQNE